MITRYIDWFIAERLRGDPDQWRRSRQLIIFSAVAPIFFLVNIIKWYRLGSMELAANMTFVMLGVSLAVPVLFKMTGSLAFLGNAIMTALAWHFAILPAFTGGVFSSALAWNLVLPVFAATFVGFRSMLFWSGCMLLVMGVYLFIHTQGIVLPMVHLSASQLLEAQIANLFGPFLAMCISLYFNETGLRHAFTLQMQALEDQRKAMRDVSAAKNEIEGMADSLRIIFAGVESTTGSLKREADEIAEITRGSAQAAERANELMKKSDTAVLQAGSSMQSLTDSMRNIAAASEEVSKIIKAIVEIAFQTNLLALNAAVEAARAGEAGAGFAVVAGEVRSLAMKAAASAQETSALVENTLRHVRSGSDLVGLTDGEVRDLTLHVNEAAGLMNEIAAGSRTQAQGLAQIKNAIDELNTLVHEGGNHRTDVMFTPKGRAPQEATGNGSGRGAIIA
jgi:hypothetical protein